MEDQRVFIGYVKWPNHYLSAQQLILDNLLANVCQDVTSECSICMDSDRPRPRKELRCGHAFHTACIDRCLSLDSRCPVCRQETSLIKRHRQHIQDQKTFVASLGAHALPSNSVSQVGELAGHAGDSRRGNTDTGGNVF